MGSNSEFHRGWRIVLAALVGLACGASPIPYILMGQLIGPIHEELGWSVGDISVSVTLFGFSAALTAPYVGSIVDRVGLRRVGLGSLLIFGIALAALALTPPYVFAWWMGWALLGLVAIGSGPLTWSRGVNLWFFRRRGLALGIALTGSRLSGVAVPFLAGTAVDTWGWRSAFPILAVLPLAIGLPIVWKWFREPRTDERPAQVGNAAGLTGMTRGEAIRDYRFWLIFASILLVALPYHRAPATDTRAQGFRQERGAGCRE